MCHSPLPPSIFFDGMISQGVSVMTYTYLTTVSVDDQVLTETVSGTTLISALTPPAYLCVRSVSASYQPRQYLSVGSIQKYATDAIRAMSVSAYVAALTDAEVLKHAHTLPAKTTLSQRYESRLSVDTVDQLTDVTVSYTNVWTPDVRNNDRKKSQLSDLVLTSSEGRDFTNALVSVNGVVHRTIYHKGELFVVDGHANMRATGKAKMSLLSTTDLGGHTIVPIQSDMILNSVKQDLTKSVYVDLGMSLQGKTVLLVLNGHLYALDGSYKKISDTSIKIDTSRIDYVKDYIHSPMTPYLHDYSGRILRHPYADMDADDMPTIRATLESFVYYLQNPIEGGAPLYRIGGETMSVRPMDQPYVLPLFQRMNFSSIAQAFKGNDTELSAFVQRWLSPMTQQQAMELIAREGWDIDSEEAQAALAKVGFYPHEWSDTPTWPPVMTTVGVMDYILTTGWAEAYAATSVTEPSVMMQYVYPAYFKNLAGVMPTIPMDFLTHQSFLEYLLISPHSFFVVINNPSVYKRIYPLTYSQDPRQYEIRSKDTPRGLLMVDGHKVVPYAISSGRYANEHLLFTEHYVPYSDLFETDPLRIAVASPVFDQPNTTRVYSAALLELYA